MQHPTAYHQLGKFVVTFQHIERSIDDILQLLVEADDEAVLILVNELEYAKRLKTADVLFARFVDIRRTIDPAVKTEFHGLIVELGSLGERRNILLHSKYSDWTNIDGVHGLIRENSKLRGGKGIREEVKEELLPEAFYPDLEWTNKVLSNLEIFRLKIVDWLYPVVTG